MMANGGAVPESWRPALEGVLATPKSRALGAFLQAEEAAGKAIYPTHDLRFAALDLTALNAVKVVILGQDPYHRPGQAHGLSFSVQPGVAVPRSLANIYKELASDLGLPRPQTGNLEPWARQGVLLLNTLLTVERGKPLSHKGMGWEEITATAIAAVAADAQPCVFMLWGDPAQKTVKRLPDGIGKQHQVLTAPHPSPLSARRGFFGCRHFSQANAFLEAQGRGAVDWRL